MNVKEWLGHQCTSEFAEDMRAYYGLDPWTFQKLADEAGIEDMDGIDVKIYSIHEIIEDKPYLHFHFQWKKDKKVLYETYLKTERVWEFAKLEVG